MFQQDWLVRVVLNRGQFHGLLFFTLSSKNKEVVLMIMTMAIVIFVIDILVYASTLFGAELWMSNARNLPDGVC